MSWQLHIGEVKDGYEWGRRNLQSVTEQNALDEFLATAELAGAEFVAGEMLWARGLRTSGARL